MFVVFTHHGVDRVMHRVEVDFMRGVSGAHGRLLALFFYARSVCVRMSARVHME